MNGYTVYVHIDPEGKRYYGATKMNINKRWKRVEVIKTNQIFWNHNKKYRIQDRVSIDATEY